MVKTFEDKVVVVTGAGSGIGQATALSFLRAGARVALVDVNENAIKETKIIAKNDDIDTGPKILCITADVSKSEYIQNMIKSVVGHWGRLDVLHNNAGIGGQHGPIVDIDDDNFDQVIAVNLRSVWLGMKYAIPVMLEQGGGVIINTGSALSLAAIPFGSPYIASKHAVAGITKAVSQEYAAQNIRINAVCPGVIETPLISKNIEAIGVTEEDPSANPVMLHPMGRLGRAQEIADAVLWLASDASSFVTGTTLSVDGGWTSR